MNVAAQVARGVPLFAFASSRLPAPSLIHSPFVCRLPGKSERRVRVVFVCTRLPPSRRAQLNGDGSCATDTNRGRDSATTGPHRARLLVFSSAISIPRNNQDRRTSSVCNMPIQSRVSPAIRPCVWGFWDALSGIRAAGAGYGYALHW